jgi:hypothetical protein
VHFSTSDTDAGVLLTADYTFQASDQGVHIFAGGVTLVTLGDQTLTATDTTSGITGSATVTVNSGGHASPGGGAVGPDQPASTPVINSAGLLTTSSVQPDQRTASVDRIFASLIAGESEFLLSRFKHDRAGPTHVLDVFRGEDGPLV